MSWSTEKGRKRGRQALPAAAPFTLIPCCARHMGRTWAMHQVYRISAGQLWQLLAAKTAATLPLPATPLSAQTDELSLGELPRSSDAVPLQSFKPSISQMAINGEFLTNLKPWLLSSKTNEHSQQKGTVFPVHEILRSTETSQQQGCEILKILCPLVLTLFLERSGNVSQIICQTLKPDTDEQESSWGNDKLLQ